MEVRVPWEYIVGKILAEAQTLVAVEEFKTKEFMDIAYLQQLCSFKQVISVAVIPLYLGNFSNTLFLYLFQASAVCTP